MGDTRHPLRIIVSATVALLVNGLLVLALLNLGQRRAGVPAEVPALTVVSLAMPKGVEDMRKKAETVAPSPPDEPASDSPPSITLPAPQLVHTLAIPPVSMPATAMAAAAVPAMSHAASSAATAASSSSQGASPASPGSIDGPDESAPSSKTRNYAAKVRSWLYAHKIYPRRARMRREEGMVRVRFVIDRAGMLLEGVVVEGSGNGTLDEEAAAMMRRASPFPKAPAEVPGERIEFVAPIEFALPV